MTEYGQRTSIASAAVAHERDAEHVRPDAVAWVLLRKRSVVQEGHDKVYVICGVQRELRQAPAHVMHFPKPCACLPNYQRGWRLFQRYPAIM